MNEDRYELADLVTNLLGALIFVSQIIVSVSAVSSGQSGRRSDRGVEASLSMLQPSWEDLPGLSQHYLVHDGVVGRLNFTAVARALRDGSGELVLETPLLEASTTLFKVTIDRAAAAADGPLAYYAIDSDLNSFKLKFSLPHRLEIARRVNPGVADLVTDIVRVSTQERGVPNFIVTESGFSTFADLYSALIKEGLCFRWSDAPLENEYEIYRSRGQFGVYEHRRCRRSS